MRAVLRRNGKMNYPDIPFLAMAVHYIVNHSMIKNYHYNKNTPIGKSLHGLMLSMMAFMFADFIWGHLYKSRMAVPGCVSAMLCYILVAGTTFHWVHFVARYLRDSDVDPSGLRLAGSLFVFLMAGMLIVNCFVPVLFRFDEAGNYHTEWGRTVALVFLSFLFLSGGIIVLVAHHRAATEKKPHVAVGISGLVMAGMVLLQVFWPLYPFYTICCLLGSSILHTFVVEKMREERRVELETLLRREEEQELELGSTRVLAYTDQLTGVKNTHAYDETERNAAQRIASGELKEFGLIVFDMNDLKRTNDTKGHEAGDDLIREASHMICSYFKHSPVFRIGGDEFVAYLEGEDFENRKELLDAFNRRVEENLREGKVIVASGLSEFRPGDDNGFRRVFERADRRMYGRKSVLKAMKV